MRLREDDLRIGDEVQVDFDIMLEFLRGAEEFIVKKFAPGIEDNWHKVSNIVDGGITICDSEADGHTFIPDKGISAIRRVRCV